MDHVKEVAKLLGVELNEEFEMLGDPTTKYRLTEVDDFDHCFEIKDDDKDYWRRPYDDEGYASLEDLICGRYAIKKLPWKPKPDDTYYRPAFNFGEPCPMRHTWKASVLDLAIWKAGLVFRTKDEAEEAGVKRVEELLKELNE